MKTRVIIMGAAGRDFHNFNVFFRDNSNYNVVCFTAEQIPNISGRKYPKELSGKLYPKGIDIYPEDQLPKLIKKFNVDYVTLAYSDLSHEDAMHKASIVIANGADFMLLGPKSTYLKSNNKLVAVTAVRTGCGKSQTTREICRILRNNGRKVVAIRHPMPYGDLKKQICQKFTIPKDLDYHNCTVEEREEYEPLIEMGVTVFAGVDYEKILREAEKVAGKNGVIIWDGGNNDLPFYKPDIHICLVDPHRPGHEISYYPGESNFRMADVILINKERTAKPDDLQIVKNNIKKYNPSAKVVDAHSVITVDKPELIRNKKVLVVEDGPTLTHGGMSYGAGYIAAKENNAEVVDPRKYAVGSLKEIYKKYKHLKLILPAMGYGKKQISELEKTINKTPCDAVISGTPIFLSRVLNSKKPIVRIQYELKVVGKTTLKDLLRKF